jgi:hypothetical protein
VIEIAGQTTKHVHHFGEMAKKKSEAAGAKIGVSMKKAVSFAGIQVIRISKTKFFSKKSENGSQEEKPEQLKNEAEHEVALEKSYVEVPILETQECDRVSASMSGSSSKLASTAKYEAYEVATECLTCENLIRCDFRGNSSAASEGQIKNSSSCRFATQLSTKSDHAQ